jgi:hypothetical protein
MASDGFTVTVTRPLSYLGKSELRVGPDSATLTVRSIRHYRSIVAFFAVTFVVLILVGGLASFSGQLALKDPGLMGSELKAAHLLSEGVPILVGVLGGLLVGVMYLLFMAFRGDPIPMTAPLSSASVEKHKGRLLVVRATFDGSVRSDRWKLSARDIDDANAIESALRGSAG